MFAGFSDTPLWRAEMALPQVPAATVEPREDVLVVGSGFTGLHTALYLARGGRQVVPWKRLPRTDGAGWPHGSPFVVVDG